MPRVALLSLLVLCAPGRALADEPLSWDREYRIAARYAPDFFQSVDLRQPRLDYLARFDFDGNWKADDNWRNAADPEIPLPAYVYYAAAETRTHFFIHYVCFHPRDWKGNWLTNGALQALKFTGRLLLFPRRLGLEALTLAHENDLEGVLVVVERMSGTELEGRTVLVESFSHHRFHTYLPADGEPAFDTHGGPVETRDQRPRLFIESRGHGIRAHLRSRPGQEVVHYRYTGRAEQPRSDHHRPGSTHPPPVGYALLPLRDTLWPHALEPAGADRAFSKFRLYDQLELADFFDEPARVGTALRGRKGGRNRATAPWGWKNNGVRGQWFFDPAGNITERHRPRGPFERDYLAHRFLARGSSGAARAPALADTGPGIP